MARCRSVWANDARGGKRPAPRPRPCGFRPMHGSVGARAKTILDPTLFSTSRDVLSKSSLDLLFFEQIVSSFRQFLYPYRS
jgi:hypothetical protein